MPRSPSDRKPQSMAEKDESDAGRDEARRRKAPVRDEVEDAPGLKPGALDELCDVVDEAAVDGFEVGSGGGGCVGFDFGVVVHELGFGHALEGEEGHGRILVHGA